MVLAGGELGEARGTIFIVLDYNQDAKIADDMQVVCHSSLLSLLNTEQMLGRNHEFIKC